MAASALLAVDLLHAWGMQVGAEVYPSFDTYQYFYRNMLYAAQAVAEGGRGLLWNPLQHCGQPFFAIGSTATLYPPHWLFLLLDPDLALRAVIFVHFVIAGTGAFLLCRELGASPAAAAAGAVSFELGNAMLSVTSWMPIVAAPYAWMPVAMLYAERILERPRFSSAVGLALALAMALLAGFPQTVLFTCQLIGLRAAWELAARRGARSWAALAMLALGLVLPLFLDAVQLLPAIETARASLRGEGLSAADMAPTQYVLTRAKIRTTLAGRRQINSALMLLPAMIAAASLVAGRPRRIATFYAVAALGYFVLAFGPATPLFAIYSRLPLASLFRAPVRFLWVTGLCLSILTALGVDALTQMTTRRGERALAGAALAAAAATAAALAMAMPAGLFPLESILVLAVIGAGVVVVLAPQTGRWAAVVLLGALSLSLAWFRVPGSTRDGWFVPVRPVVLPRLLPDGGILRAEAETFTSVRERVTAQDRLYLVYRAQSPSFAAKTAAQFGLPAVQDYEPQPSRRVAAYVVMMRSGLQLKSVEQYYFVLGGSLPPQFRRRLLDLAAGRYLVVEPKAEEALEVLEPPPSRIPVAGRLAVYDNQLALPRAFYVPRVEVVSDADDLLRRLADGDDDLRRVAFVEAEPTTHFTGAAGNDDGGEVEFVRDAPEHVVLRVRARERGFVHIADQYAPGWRATVGGVAAPILRANFLFRAVEVPAGESIVEMRYVPPGLLPGAAISLVTLLALAAYAVRSRLRSRARSATG